MTFTDARAEDLQGDDVDLITLDGVIIILAETPVPTPTQTVGPTFTVCSASAPSDCSVVPACRADPAGSWLLLGGALFLLVRRHR